MVTLDNDLTLELKQTTRISPQIIQTSKLIELTGVELHELVQKELDENPFLEEDEQKEEEEEPRKISISDLGDDYVPAYKTQTGGMSRDPLPTYNRFSVKDSFLDSLMEQLGFCVLSDFDYKIGTYIIGSLDDDGYLRRDIESIVDDLAFRLGIETTPEHALGILKLIQSFEPAGVGARSLQECLLLQIRTLTPEESTENARLILTDYFKEFTQKHFSRIISRTGLSQAEVKAAIDKILRLNPSPGGSLDDSYIDQAQQIVPDFFLETVDEQMHLTLPRFNCPELRINRKYADMLLSAKGMDDKQRRETETFVKRKIDSAKFYIDNIRQRYNTLKTTMEAIIEMQKDFFLSGDPSSMRPMVLKDVAEYTGYDISTISRVASSKYIETRFGIFSLKYFFSEGMSSSSGKEVSTREIKEFLLDLIRQEDKSKPLTDDDIVARLQSAGYQVARRTVAKYRDQLSIPTARMRKEIL